MALNLRKKIYLLNSLAIIILLAFVIFIFKFQIPNILSLKNQISEKSKQLENYKLKQEDLEKFKKGSEKNKEIKKTLDQSLVDRGRVLDFIIKLEEIAKKTNNEQTIQIVEDKKEVKRKKETKKQITDPLEKIDKLEAQIFLNGKFRNLISYLYYLEALSYYTDIYSLEIKGTEEKTPKTPFEEATIEEGKIRTKLDLKIFTK